MDYIKEGTDQALIAELERNNPTPKQIVKHTTTRKETGTEFVIWCIAMVIICFIGLIWTALAS